MKKKEKIKKSNSGLPNLVFYGLLVLLFYPPFFRGLLFDKELLITHLITAVLFAGFYYLNLKQPRVRFLSNGMDWAAVGLLFIYIISSFTALIPRDAVREVLKLSNYIMVFFMVSYFSVEVKQLKKLLNIIFFSGVGVTIAGILAAGGLFFIPGNLINSRLSSTIGYPNTFAAYLTSMLVIGLYLAVTAERKSFKWLYGMLNSLIFFGFLWTQSRGALLILPIVLILFVIGLIKQYRGKLFYEIVLTVSTAIVTYILVFNQAKAYGLQKGLLLIFAGLLFNIAINFILDFIISRVSVPKGRTLLAIGITGVILSLLLIVGAFGDDLKPLFSRFAKISLEERTLQQRVAFDRDAIEVIKDFPVLGTGGGGWGSIYKKYQSFGYLSRAVHNHFLQTWVEAGVFGFAFFIGLWFMFSKNVFNLCFRSTTAQRTNVWALFVAAVALGLHSLIDFTLMFGSMSLVLWSFFGVVRGIDAAELKYKGTTSGGQSLALKYCISVVLIFVIGTSGYLLIGYNYGQIGQGLYKVDKDMSQAYLEKATKFDLLNSVSPYLLSKIWKDKGTKAQKDDLYETNDKLEKSLTYATTAIKLDKGNPEYYINRGKILFRVGEVDDAIKDYEKALELFPLNREQYELLAQAYLKAGRYFAERNEIEKAKQYYQLAIDMPNKIENKANSLSDREKKMWVGSVPIPEPSQLLVETKIKATEQLKGLE